ncbi:cytochrome P450 [Paractinoplanes rishiriensis]|uniref:Cytochrome P450 n=1 Tax=Paractinoplanes rishiriensis TaxID=1050105 RepID=A0A919JXG6_9ACTN|nr:cytochrome P450 [Actinoplanes rishiriensis]GIE95444.1 cytochrome P450 [Actinoplanes rishiriensis]
MKPAPPLPRHTSRLGVSSALAFRRNPLGFLGTGVDDCGDVYRFSLLGLPVVLVNHPDYIQHVLVENGENYDKNAVLFRIVRPVLRQGLIGNADIELWRRQRRMMAPHFTPRTVQRFAEFMTEETELTARQWRPGSIVDLTDAIGQLALRIVNRSLFSAAVGPRARAFEEAFGEANTILGRYFRFPFPPLSVPTRAHRRLRSAIARMDDFVATSVRERVEAGARADDRADLLTLLLNSVDDDRAMDAQQLHDEVLNLCIGAYETTTNTLAWAFYLLARHPEVEAAVHAEVDTVLGGRTPEFADLANLPYIRMVVDETLRLYSPAYQFMRRARKPDEIGGHRIPAGTNVLINSYLLHRHPDFWPDAERFDPTRFSPERVAERPKHAYVPFGSGQRVCIGKHFALTELTLVLATIAQHHRFVAPYEPFEISPDPLITLHPKGGVHLRVLPRESGRTADPEGAPR